MSDKSEIIEDPNGFFTVKDKPSPNKLEGHYEKLYKEFDNNSKN